jgi:putative membrane protein
MKMTETSPIIDPVAGKSPSERTPLKSSGGSYSDHLANERTFLAWTRTGLGIFAVGCAVARFGGTDNSRLTLNGSFEEIKAPLAGLILVVFSILILCYGIYRFYRINRQLERKDVTDISKIHEPIIATVILLLCIIAILVILIIL